MEAIMNYFSGISFYHLVGAIVIIGVFIYSFTKKGAGRDGGSTSGQSSSTPTPTPPENK